MRIKIEKQINAETKETWSFNTFDLNVVFVGWKCETKPKDKRKWIILSYWDKYSHRGYGGIEEPALPEDIKNQALNEVIKHIKVQTWDEWKNNKINTNPA